MQTMRHNSQIIASDTEMFAISAFQGVTLAAHTFIVVLPFTRILKRIWHVSQTHKLLPSLPPSKDLSTNLLNACLRDMRWYEISSIHDVCESFAGSTICKWGSPCNQHVQNDPQAPHICEDGRRGRGRGEGEGEEEEREREREGEWRRGRQGREEMGRGEEEGERGRGEGGGRKTSGRGGGKEEGKRSSVYTAAQRTHHVMKSIVDRN